MALEPDVLASKGSDIDHAEEVGLARLNRHGQILGLIEECVIRHWLCSSRVALADEARQ